MNRSDTFPRGCAALCGGGLRSCAVQVDGARPDSINRTVSDVLRALVRASADRLAPAMIELSQTARLPGWQVRVLDGNLCPNDAYDPA